VVALLWLLGAELLDLLLDLVTRWEDI